MEEIFESLRIINWTSVKELFNIANPFLAWIVPLIIVIWPNRNKITMSSKERKRDRLLTLIRCHEDSHAFVSEVQRRLTRAIFITVLGLIYSSFAKLNGLFYLIPLFITLNLFKFKNDLDKEEIRNELLTEIDSSFSKQNIGNKGLLIVSASYGSTGKTSNVTEIISRKLSGGPVDFHVTNDELGGDPFPGRVKELNIIYEINGKISSITLLEGQIVSYSGDSIRAGGR